jgi:type IV secretory pathway VirB4 component
MALPSKQDFGNSLDLVDIKEIKEGTVILKDNSLRQIVMVGGVNFALKSDTEQNIIVQGYQTFLNSVDFPLQILVHSRKVNIDRYLETLAKRKEVEESAMLQSQIDEYVEFIKGFVQKNAIMEKTFLIVVPFFPLGGVPGVKTAQGLLPSFLGGKKKGAETDAKNKEDAEKNLLEEVAQLGQRTNQVITGILGMGLEATLLTDEALIELFYNFYNPQTVERQNITVPRE